MVKFYLRGAHPNPGAAGSTQPRGFMLWELGGSQQTKVAPQGGFPWENFIYGELTSTLGPEGLPNQMGVYALRNLQWRKNKSCSSGWVYMVKFYFWGANPDPKAGGSTPPNGGTYFENFTGNSKQKLLLGVGLPGRILFLGAHFAPGTTGSTHSKGGICFWAIFLKFIRRFSFHLDSMIGW
jgi:hypothetical protein